MRGFAMLRSRGRPDYVMIACMAILVLFGLVMLGSASFDIAEVRFGDTLYYLKQQIIFGFGVGLVGFFVASKLRYRAYSNVAVLFFILSLGLIALLYTPFGVEAKGAVRSVAIGPVSFQPAEILKITFIIYLAAWLSASVRRQRRFLGGFVPFLVITALIGVPLILQRSTSTTFILMVTALVMYFVSGAKMRYVVTTVMLGAAAFLAISAVTPYRWERIINFIDRGFDIHAGGFHLQQSLIAIGSGGLTGVGYGESSSKLSYLPEVLGDSIFAIIAEELGFVVVSLLLLVYVIFVLRFFLDAKRMRNSFGQLLLVGFGTIILMQSVINVGAVSGLLPLTGTPLPFISFGKTSLAVFMTMTGIAVNVSRYS